MRKVIRIDKIEGKEKPVEFTHTLDINQGWKRVCDKPGRFHKIVYLGRCDVDGDMFACYSVASINIYKGHLNSGKYE